jgi:hypothetical protein
MVKGVLCVRGLKFIGNQDEVFRDANISKGVSFELFRVQLSLTKLNLSQNPRFQNLQLGNIRVFTKNEFLVPG